MTAATCAVPYLTACQAVGTLVMEAVRRETRYFEQKSKQTTSNDSPELTYVQDVHLFNHRTTSKFVTVTAEHKLCDVMTMLQSSFGATDCAQPMLCALEKFKASNGKQGLYDLFIIYTDNETYYGNVHPSEALDQYNKITGLTAKMVVVATTPTNSSIEYGHRSCVDSTDPRNSTPRALNIVGFDLNAPTLIKNFASGQSGSVVGQSAHADEDPDCGFEMIDADE